MFVNVSGPALTQPSAVSSNDKLSEARITKGDISIHLHWAAPNCLTKIPPRAHEEVGNSNALEKDDGTEKLDLGFTPSALCCLACIPFFVD